MSDIVLPALSGRNPLGFLAALGVLDVLDRVDGGSPTLRWSGGLAAHAIVTAEGDLEGLVATLDAAREPMLESVLLNWGPAELPLADLKPDPDVLRQWVLDIARAGEEARWQGDLFCALIAEGAVAGAGGAKPTHLHFTAGQQRFLNMVRHLGRAVGPNDLREALLGPWVFTSSLPTLGWHAGGERSYALRATDPSGGQRPGVPGADWLAFLGLALLPVVARGTALRTTGCGAEWKRSWFRWPLWTVPLTRRTTRSLLADASLADASTSKRAARGVSELLESPIRRTDQGGYGSFGPPVPVVARRPTSQNRGDRRARSFA